MTNKDNGKPAFPTTKHDAWGKPVLNGGMTLRDYFAAKAMQSMVSTPTYESGGWAQEDIAWQSYQMADAMLKERNK